MEQEDTIKEMGWMLSIKQQQTIKIPHWSVSVLRWPWDYILQIVPELNWPLHQFFQSGLWLTQNNWQPLYLEKSLKIWLW